MNRHLDPVDVAAARLLPAPAARALGALPVRFDGDRLVVACSHPRPATLTAVEALTGRAIVAVEVTAAEVAEAITRVHGVPAVRRPPAEAKDVEATRLQTAERSGQIGSLLRATGLIDELDLETALATQARSGSRLGEVLVHSGIVDERELARALGSQLQLPDIDVSAFEPEPAALELVSEATARRHRIVPLSLRNGELCVATADPLDARALAAAHEQARLPLRVVVTSRHAVDSLLQRLHARQYVRTATASLATREPSESAHHVLSVPQKLIFLLVLAIAAVIAVRNPIEGVIGLNAATIVFYAAFSVYKLKLVFAALHSELELPVSEEEVSTLDERTLPVYTILVPLYREAAVVGRLTKAIAALDYPRAKLDIKLIVEEDDVETIEALRAMRLPAHFKLVVVPDAPPKTKPKACNYGLIQAEGRYAVIYDAEDLPEPDQLKKVVIAFRKAEARIVCIQCKLNYYNRDQNLLTRWFTSEYSNWFDLLMPGLDAADAPIPLGGTSNHFMTEKLVEVGAWDPFNVTEDADLGIRLHKAGYKTAIIDSTTFEEANSELYNWVRQRSRWVKGYVQTWLVHMRHPVRLWRQIGWRSWFSFQFMIAGTFVSFLVNPLYWLMTTMWGLTQASLIHSFFPGWIYFAASIALLFGNFTFTYVNVAGAMRRRYYDLVPAALLSPLYWALMSVGAWKGVLQLFYRPFYWEKTVHGLTDELEPYA